MRKKIVISVLLLVVGILVLATWQYRLLCLLILIILWRQKIKVGLEVFKYKHSYRVLVGIICLLIWLAIPNYWQRGRTQLIYLDQQGKSVNVPMQIYLLNAILPEKEVLNLSVKLVSIMPLSWLETARYGGEIVKDVRREFWNFEIRGFYSAYNYLSLTGSNPGRLLLHSVGI